MRRTLNIIGLGIFRVIFGIGCAIAAGVFALYCFALLSTFADLI